MYYNDNPWREVADWLCAFVAVTIAALTLLALGLFTLKILGELLERML